MWLAGILALLRRYMMWKISSSGNNMHLLVKDTTSWFLMFRMAWKWWFHHPGKTFHATVRATPVTGEDNLCSSLLGHLKMPPIRPQKIALALKIGQIPFLGCNWTGHIKYIHIYFYNYILYIYIILKILYYIKYTIVLLYYIYYIWNNKSYVINYI